MGQDWEREGKEGKELYRIGKGIVYRCLHMLGKEIIRRYCGHWEKA